MPPLSITIKRQEQVERLQNAWDSFLDQQQEKGKGKSTDTILFCDDGCVPVHAPILAGASAFFKEAFLSQGNNYLQFRTVILAGFNVMEIKLVVQFIYAGFVNVESLDDVEVVKDLLNYFFIPTAGADIDNGSDPDERTVLYYEESSKDPKTEDEDNGSSGEVTENMKEEAKSSTSTEEEEELMRFQKDEPGLSSDEDVPLQDLRNKKTNVAGGSIPKARPTKVQVPDTPKSKPLSSSTIHKLQKLAELNTNGNEKARKHPPVPTVTPIMKSIDSPKRVGNHKAKPEEVGKSAQKKVPEAQEPSTSSRPRRQVRRTRKVSTEKEDSEKEEENEDEEDTNTGKEEESGNDDEEYVPSPPRRKLRERRVDTYRRDSDDGESDASDVEESSPKANARSGNGRKTPANRVNSSSSSTTSQSPAISTPGRRGRPPGGPGPSTSLVNSSNGHGNSNGTGTGRQPRNRNNAASASSTDGDEQEGDVFLKPLEDAYEEDVDEDFYQDTARIFDHGCRCAVCKKTFKTPIAASDCVTMNHKPFLRCWMCYSAIKGTEGLYDHYKRKHQKTARKDTLQCPYYNCQQPLSFRSLSTHVMSIHLTKTRDADPSTPGKRSSSSTSSSSSVPPTPKKPKQHHTDSSNESPKDGELLITKSTGGQQVTFKLNYKNA